jgi:hypothetical protein
LVSYNLDVVAGLSVAVDEGLSITSPYLLDVCLRSVRSAQGGRRRRRSRCSRPRHLVLLYLHVTLSLGMVAEDAVIPVVAKSCGYVVTYGDRIEVGRLSQGEATSFRTALEMPPPRISTLDAPIVAPLAPRASTVKIARASATIIRSFLMVSLPILPACYPVQFSGINI